MEAASLSGVLSYTKLCGSSLYYSDDRFSRVGVYTLGENDVVESHHSHAMEEKIGVLLLNLGGPETLKDVQPFLYNLFADPDIIQLPGLFKLLQWPLAKLTSVLRAPKSEKGYAAIGGGSPLRKITDEQANALRMALEAKNVNVSVYVGMRYWYPFTEEVIEQVDTLLDSIKWDDKGLAVAIAQNVDTGAILMQGFVNRDALATTITSRKATFFSRSRATLWTKGETSNNFINIYDIFVDCDRDSIIYLGKPDGPTCHTGSETCYFTSIGDLFKEQEVEETNLALTTLYSLEATISKRELELAGKHGKPSWTKRLLLDENLLCSKIREEADELCRTLEEKEDSSCTASEMADVIYDAMSFIDLQFPNGQLTYVSYEGLTTSAFLPLCGGLLQAQGLYPGEMRYSFSCKNKWGTRITPMVLWPDKSFALGLSQALAWKWSGLMMKLSIQFRVRAF